MTLRDWAARFEDRQIPDLCANCSGPLTLRQRQQAWHKSNREPCCSKACGAEHAYDRNPLLRRRVCQAGAVRLRLLGERLAAKLAGKTKAECYALGYHNGRQAGYRSGVGTRVRRTLERAS